MFPNWAKNILFLLVYMISGLILILIIEGLMSGTELIPFNTAIESVVTRMRTPTLTTIIITLTHLGSPFVLSLLSILIAGFLTMKGDSYDALLFLVSMGFSILAFVILKDTFQISRPDSNIFQSDGWSFPSGHATVATTFFFLFAHSFFRRMKKFTHKLFLVSGSILGALLICFSRLYLGAHWALDILAGIALGLLSVSFMVLVFGVFLEDREWLGRRGVL